MKDKIKHFVKQNPILEKYSRLFINGKDILKTKPKKLIKWKNNKIKIERVYAEPIFEGIDVPKNMISLI